MQATALFGGSFDPPHTGHVRMIEAALARPDVAEVWVLPVWRHRSGKALTPYVHRLAMARLLPAEVGPRVIVRETEREIDGDGRSLPVVRRLVADWPGRMFRFLMGEDVARHFPQWPGADEIARLAPPLVLPRPAGVVSSRGIRSALADGRAEGHADLPDAVAAYVAAHGLYPATPPHG